ncbi:MAG TPA: beta-ketoacyl-[acyl-carrier-protein] synthase family protein [Planctomycetota bacterium]|nr:beta-ketoacyl-[acyl-carrier-protein] synthase family protein [Planctomycetota bacterium]
MTRRVVVTGLGLVTPLGHDLETVWERLLAGACGVAAPRRLGASKPPTRAVGEVPEADVATLRAEHGPDADTTDLRTIFGVAAARRALAHAGIVPGSHPRAGAAVASGPGAHRLEDFVAGSDAAGAFDAAAFARGTATVHGGSLWRSPIDRPATEIARRAGLGGPVLAITTACAASLQAIGSAVREIRAGRADWMLAGGADAMVDPLGLVFFVLLGAAATEAGPAACRPFSRRRTGIVTGEGAGIAVLEAEEHARARGARILAEVAGYGSSFDAFRVTAPHPEGRGAAEAMAKALADARMDPAEVDAISAHATGTKLNDPAEAKAIRSVFGARADRIAVSSGKSAMGHLLAAAGSVAFATTVLSIARDVVPPTINVAPHEVDPSCALDHVLGTARATPVRAALVNALAFGGHNATIALRKPREPRRA